MMEMAILPTAMTRAMTRLLSKSVRTGLPETRNPVPLVSACQ